MPQPPPEPHRPALACQPSLAPWALPPRDGRASGSNPRLPRPTPTPQPCRGGSGPGSRPPRIDPPARRPAARSARALPEPGLRPHWACPGCTGQLGSRAGTQPVAARGRGQIGRAGPSRRGGARALGNCSWRYPRVPLCSFCLYNSKLVGLIASSPSPFSLISSPVL